MRGTDEGHRDLLAAIGKAIRLRRVELDLSRAELAEAAGLSYAYVSEIENGTKQASSKALWRLAEALGLQPHQLMAAAARPEPAGPPPDPARFWPARSAALSVEEPAWPRRWFHDAPARGGGVDSPPAEAGRHPELGELLERIAVALEDVPDERAELVLMLALDERRTRRIVREELDRRER